MKSKYLRVDVSFSSARNLDFPVGEEGPANINM
jgi:hypothetical protein